MITDHLPASVEINTVALSRILYMWFLKDHLNEDFFSHVIFIAIEKQFTFCQFSVKFAD
jgi:hypothetical protein